MLVRCLLSEVFRFSMIRPDAGIQEEKPIVDFDSLVGALRVGDAMVGVVGVDQILQYRPSLKQSHHLAVGVDVGQNGHASVGIEREEPAFLVSVLVAVKFVDVVR